MIKRNPGVPEVLLYVAISRVRKFTTADNKAIDQLIRLTSNCPWLDTRTVIWKGNVGHDFSSAEACLRTISETANADDYVMIRNRSGYGPSKDSWYSAYVKQFNKSPAMGLVGSTINFDGYHRPTISGIKTHVQTYVYLSKWQHLKPLYDQYPGARCTDRKELIIEGEIGLSRYMMDCGLQLSCLHWPNHVFGVTFPKDPKLPQIDIKKTVTDIPIRYKYSSYLRQLRKLPWKLIWLIKRCCGLVFPGWCPKMHVNHLYLKEYD